MSDQPRSRFCNSGHLRVGTPLAWKYGETFGLEVTVLRILRIALLTLVPTLALGALASGCGDDTTTTPTQDLSVAHDMPPVVHDMAPTHD